MKRTRLPLFLLCLLLLLPGCTAQKREPVRALQCTHPTALSTIRSTGGGDAAVCWADYENERTTVQLVDVNKDTVRKEVTLEGVWDLKEQSFADGRLALCCRDTNTWKFLTSSLAETGTMDAENVDGFFSYDGGEYYFLRDHVLFRQSTADGQTDRLPLSLDLRILDMAAFDAPSGRLAVQAFLSPYNTECGTAIIDVSTGELSMLQQDRFQVAFSDSGLSLLHFDMYAMGYDALFSSGDQFYFAAAALFTGTVSDLYAISDSPYLMGIAEDSSFLYNTGPQITVCYLPGLSIRGEMYTSCYLPEEKLLVGAVYDDDGFRLYVLDPAQLPFQSVADADAMASPLVVDETLSQAYWSAVSGLPLPENLQEARQYADQLEDAYGVRILLSGQCSDAAALCDRTITLTDTMDASEEVASIRTMLEAMGRAFALYPDGFLPQFRNDVGEGGLCFLLVAHIDSDYGVVGCAYEAADWQYIALDVQSVYRQEGTICHEIWHATENRILSSDYTAFDFDKWAALNPKDFVYSGDGTLQDPAQPWVLYNSPIEDVHFVDSYSCVAASEDRARIMEFFMAHEEEAQQLIRSPYIRQKLQWMCDAVRQSFDTTGWQNVRWEQLLDRWPYDTAGTAPLS